MCFLIVFQHELSKAIGIGILDNKQFSTAATADLGRELIGIQESRILVTPDKVFFFINIVSNIIAVIVIYLLRFQLFSLSLHRLIAVSVSHLRS